MRNICSGGHGNRTSLREVIGVLDQVDEHLEQHQTVTVQEPPFAVNRKPQSDTSLTPLFVEQLCQVVLQLADVHKLDLRRLVLEAGEKRDVRRKRDETVDVALHDVEVANIAWLFPQQFEISPDGSQGSLEFVGSVRDEIGLDARQRHGAGDVENDNRLRNSVQDGRECRRLRTFALDEYLALPQQRIACSLRSSELGDVGAHCKACQALH